MLPTWLFLVCAAAAWWGLRRPARMLPVFLVACVFGSSAALEVVLLGGAPVTPALFFVPFLVAAALRQRGPQAVLAGVSLREAGGWLALFVGWAILTAVFVPRLLAGQLLVYTTSRTDVTNLGVQLTALQPNTTNLTQSVYLLVGLTVFLAARALAADPRHHASIRHGVYAAAAVNAALTLLDGIAAVSGVELGLSFVRNANYAVVSQSIGGWPRLQGAFSEPAALACFSIVLFAFLLGLWLRGVEPRSSGTLALVTAGVLVLSTSSTAFVTLAIVLGVAAAVQVGHAVLGEHRLRFGVLSAVLLAGLALGCVLLLWSPPALERLVEIVRVMVFEKASSASAVERLAWVEGTWGNFVDTYGLGTGAGSARGSSYPFVVLGNTGVPGALALLAVIGLLLGVPGRPADAQASALLFAARMAFVGALSAAFLVATMIDPGPVFFVAAGLVAGLLRATGPAGRHGLPTVADVTLPGAWRPASSR